MFSLAVLMPARYRALVLVAAFASLRWGEATALRRDVIDLEAGSIYVGGSVVELPGHGPAIGPAKTAASVRVVALPAQVVDVLKGHLAVYVNDEPKAFVFTGTLGAVIRRGNFNKLIRWKEHVAAMNLDGLHFHDLRHTGNTLAARVPGTSTRDLMQRMGHDSMRAAMIYQHAARDAQQRIAAGLTTQLDEHGGRSATARGQHAHPAGSRAAGSGNDETPGNRGL